MPPIVLTDAERDAALPKGGADLKFLFERNDVPVQTMAKWFHIGVVTSEKFANIAKDVDDLVAVLRDHLGINQANTLEERVQVAAITCAWSNARTRVARAAEIEAEMDTKEWTKPLVNSEWLAMKAGLEKAVGVLDDKATPSKEYVEKKLQEVEAGDYRAEDLAEVVSRDEVDPDAMVPQWDARGNLTVKRGASRIRDPENPEGLRARLTVMKNAYQMVALKHTNRPELQGEYVRVFEEYKEYLLGEHVFGLHARDAEGLTLAAPPFRLVLSYEKAIRKDAVRRVNQEQVPFPRALKLAWRDPTTKERYFTTPLALCAKRPVPVAAKPAAAPPSLEGAPWKKQKPEVKGKGRGKGGGKQLPGCAAQNKDGVPICYRFNTAGEKCKEKKCRVEVIEVDLRHRKGVDLSQAAVQRKWLEFIDSGKVDALLVTPPCSTFSRASWANDDGPFPLRPSRCPRGFTWNSKPRRAKAELGNNLADFSFEAMRRQLVQPAKVAVMEQPEDLGATSNPRVPGHRPASMWQFSQHAQLAALPGVSSVVLAQKEFGTDSVKPTRLLLRVRGPLHPAMFVGMPHLDDQGNYMGPLPKMVGAPLIGRSKGEFKTAAAAAWPPKLCEWVATQFMTSFEHSANGECHEKRSLEEDVVEEGRVVKRPRTEEEVEVDPFFPPVRGGAGPARGCLWKGHMVPYHDGGCLLSPGRWDLGKRKYPMSLEWQGVRKELRRALVGKAGGESRLEKECFSMARGEAGCKLVQDECLRREILEILSKFCGGSEEAEDGDYAFLEEAKDGLPLGIKFQLPRTPASFERQVEWSLEDDPSAECLLSKSNYPSAREHEEHLREHLEEEVAEGLVEKMSRSEFEKKYGSDRAIAALAVLVEDEMSGKKRVIHDASHGVRVNHRIRCQDKLRMPGGREKRFLLSRFRAARSAVFSVIGDFGKAHRRFKYREEERGFLGRVVSEEDDVVYVNKVGTFGVTSTPYWWGRISGALIRLTHYLLGPDVPIELLLYADDLEAMGITAEGRKGIVASFAYLAALGSPFKWKKHRGGLCTEWIGLTTDYANFSLGISEKRAQWLAKWIAMLCQEKVVEPREFAAVLGRLGFSTTALPWEKPFLGPLYVWSAAVRDQKKKVTVPWAVLIILDWIAGRLCSEGRMEVVSPEVDQEEATVSFFTDARASDEDACIGGFLDVSSNRKECPWFSIPVDEKLAPWLRAKGGSPKRVIAALELLATLVAVKVWGRGARGNLKGRMKAYTDNRGNSFALCKGMSTKFPLTILLIELAEELRMQDRRMDLEWVRREENTEADDLSNGNCEEFDAAMRVDFKGNCEDWLILDKVQMRGEELYKDIQALKEQRKRKNAEVGCSTQPRRRKLKVPMLDLLGDPARRLQGLDMFYYPCFGSLLLAFFAANFHFTTAMKVSMTGGLLLSSCCAVVSAVLTADMSEKAPHLADVGVRLAWGLLCGSMAQYIGAQLGQALFLWNSWSAVCGFASICVWLARRWTHQAHNHRSLVLPVAISLIQGCAGADGAHLGAMSLASCCVVQSQNEASATDADTAAEFLSKFQSKHAEVAKLVAEEEDMLLTLSFFLEKMRFEAGLGAGQLETATPDSTKTDERQASNATSDIRALHSVQFSKRVSEIKKQSPDADDHHLHPDADSSGMKPTRSRPIPASLHLSPNTPPSPVKSRNGKARGDSSKGSGASRFPDSIGNMYSINGLGDAGREMRSSFKDMVNSLHYSENPSCCCSRYFGNMLLSISGFFDMLYTLKEPHRKGCLANFVGSQFFGLLSTIVILTNAVFIFFATDYEMQNIGGSTPMFFRVTDLALSSCYVLEVGLKLVVHRGFFFWNVEWAWNGFDFFLVLFSIVENLLSYEVLFANQRSSDPVNLGFLRLLRLCKIVKILRIFRTLRVFSELRLMLDCVLGSLLNCMWCIVMLIFVMYIFALLVQQTLVGFLQEEGDDKTPEEIGLLYQYFGSVQITLITLFQAITSGVDWHVPYEVLRISGSILPAAFVFYVAFVFISVWNIVTSTFVEKALKLAQPDIDLLVVEQQLRDFEDTQMLAQLFADMLQTDEEGEHKVGLKEFQNLLETYQFRSYLNTRGIDIKNAETFFKMLVELQGEPTIDAITFANACVRMKGAATSIDLQTVMFTTHLMNKEQRRAFQFMYNRLQKIESMLTGGDWSESVALNQAPPSTTSHQLRCFAARRASLVRFAMQPEPLVLKVMRLRQPSTAPLSSEVSVSGGPAVPKALVPMALQKCLVGEQFTGYLHITNTSGQVVDNVGLRVEIDVGASKYTLLNTASASKNLPAGESVDALVEHALSTAGTYALTCIVSYSCNGEQGQFRRAYRFPALAPFAVSQRVVQLDRQLLVECLVENSTEGSIFLSSWRLDCAEGLQSELLTEMDPIIGSSGPLLKQRGCFSLVFRVTPQDESIDSATLRQRELVGALSLCWQVPDGPRGCMEGHQIQVKAMSVFELDLQVVQCPAQVKVEEPFSLELQVTNRTGELLQPKVQCMTGEGLLLNVSPSMLGREVRQMVSKKLALKRGAKLVLHHGTAALGLNQTLQEQGIVSDFTILSCTYMPANLYAAGCFIQGLSTSEEALEGITCFTLKLPGEYLHHLPESLEDLTVGFNSNQGLNEMTMPNGLQTLTFGRDFNQSLEGVTLPSSLQTLTFGGCCNQSFEGVTLPPSLEALTFGHNFNQSLEGVTLPPSLQTLTFGQNFNKSLAGVTLPSSLQTLTFGQNFNQSLAGVTLPSSLKTLTFGYDFNQSFEGVPLPPSLQTLTFGGSFNQSFEGVTLPPSLQALTLGHNFNQSLEGVTLPPGLQTLTFGQNLRSLERVTLPSSVQTFTLFCDNPGKILEQFILPPGLQMFMFGCRPRQGSKGVTLPPSLQRLSFHALFDQSLERVTLPTSLQTLTFGFCFNQSLEGVTLPSSLQTLTFGQDFNQSLERVTLPSSLQTLTFGGSFNQSFEGVTLPPSLQSLTFGFAFDQSLEGVTLPPSLRTLTFGYNFSQSLAGVTLPSSLQTLTLGHNFNQSLEGVTLPPSLQTLTFGQNFNQSFEGVTLPSSLQTLTLGQNFNQSLERVTLPSSLQTLTFGKCFNQSLKGVMFPEKLEDLLFGEGFVQSLDGVNLPISLKTLGLREVAFDLRLMGAVKLQGPCLSQPLHLEPGQRQRLPIELVITVPGLHSLQGVSIACDKVGPERLDFGVLCDLLAF
eukprot:s1943_g4.t1